MKVTGVFRKCRNSIAAIIFLSTKLVEAGSIFQPHLILQLRGGTSKPDNSPYELNPNYIPPKRPMTLEDLEQAEQFYLQTNDFSAAPSPPIDVYMETQLFGDDSPNVFDKSHLSIQAPIQQPQQEQQQSLSLVTAVQRFIQQLHSISPALSHTLLACCVIFVFWQLPVPSLQRILHHYFVCSSFNLRKGRLPVLILSTISHSSFFHLAFNLIALTTLGPTVRHDLASSTKTVSTARWGQTKSKLLFPWDALWPLFLGSALAGSVGFLLLNDSAASCMGLSAVTISLLAIYGRFHPTRNLGILLAGIFPVRLPAWQLVQLVLLWSIIGSMLPWLAAMSTSTSTAMNTSNVAHAAHLGGLLFGLLYYEIWTRQNSFVANAGRWKTKHIWSRS